MIITKGKAYTPASTEWEAVVTELRLEDDVVAWFDDGTGARGKLVAYTYDGLGTQGQLVRGGYGGTPGKPHPTLVELTVTALAPRGPEWAGSQVVRAGGSVWQPMDPDDADHDVWYDNVTERTTQQIEAYGGITVLLDAEGRIPVDSVLSVNGVTRWDLIDEAARDSSMNNTYWERIVDAILTKLGGKS